MNAAKGKPGGGFQLYFVPDTIPNKLNWFCPVQNIIESPMTGFPLAVLKWSVSQLIIDVN